MAGAGPQGLEKEAGLVAANVVPRRGLFAGPGIYDCEPLQLGEHRGNRPFGD